MHKTVFKITRMDCPSEEQIIRMALSQLPHINWLDFDIPNRTLIVFHSENNPQEIFQHLDSLKFNTTLESSIVVDDLPIITRPSGQEQKILWQVLLINFFFFILEFITGFFSNSMGLVADGLDMLADSIVYSLALFAIGGTVARKKNITKLAGYFQLGLAMFGFTEAIKRFIGFEKIPAFQTMIVISVLALIGNWLCLYLLQKSKSEEVHIQASMIFTSSDIIANLGVIVAGVLVSLTESKYPDLIVGGIVFFLVGKGALKILQLST